MIHQLLFISLTIILVMLAVMTCITYYFREKDKYVRLLIVDSIKAADDIRRTIKAKEKEEADRKRTSTKRHPSARGRATRSFE